MSKVGGQKGKSWRPKCEPVKLSKVESQNAQISKVAGKIRKCENPTKENEEKHPFKGRSLFPRKKVGFGGIKEAGRAKRGSVNSPKRVLLSAIKARLGRKWYQNLSRRGSAEGATDGASDGGTGESCDVSIFRW